MKNVEQKYTDRDKRYAIFASLFIPIMYAFACLKSVKGVVKVCEQLIKSVNDLPLPFLLKAIIDIVLFAIPFFSLPICMCYGYKQKIDPLMKATYADDYEACLQKYKSWDMIIQSYNATKSTAEKVLAKIKMFAGKLVGFAKNVGKSVLLFASNLVVGFVNKVSDAQHFLSHKGKYFLHLTENQNQLLLRAVQTMMQMYSGNLYYLLEDIGRQYNTENVAKVVLRKFMYMYTIRPVDSRWIPIHRLMNVFYNRSFYNRHTPEYPWTMKLTMREIKVLREILQTYMDISMGRFYVILEELPPEYPAGNSFWEKYHSACLNGTSDLLDARDMLIPSMHDIPWRAGNGILSPNISNEAKMAYQILCVLTDTVPLPVTEEPLPYLS